TGGSNGIGRHLAQVLAAEGAIVAVGSRDPDRSEPWEQGPADSRIVPFKLDVCDRSSVDEAVARIEEDLGPIDYLVNAAGIAASVPCLSMAEEQWPTVMETKLSGTWRVSQAVARRMVERGRGVILNFSSVAGIRP